VHVDELAELVYRPVNGAPAVSDTVPAWACCLGEQRREALHPPEESLTEVTTS
jgi:hypothetical protein